MLPLIMLQNTCPKSWLQLLMHHHLGYVNTIYYTLHTLHKTQDQQAVLEVPMANKKPTVPMLQFQATDVLR